MLRTEHLIDIHRDLCSAARDLMAKKNNDYGSTGDVFANFTRTEAMGIASAEVGILVRIVDKISRVHSHVSGRPLEAESFEDAIVDIINYSVLLWAYDQNKEGVEATSPVTSPVETLEESTNDWAGPWLYTDDSASWAKAEEAARKEE